MARRRAVTLLALLHLLAPVGMLAAADGETATDTIAVIETVLNDIGARTTDCPTDVMEAARLREMGAMCARFEGDFEAFRMKWRKKLPTVESKTGWSVNGSTYDRIYAVGVQAVGVRFSMGDILVVYK